MCSYDVVHCDMYSIPAMFDSMCRLAVDVALVWRMWLVRRLGRGSEGDDACAGL